MNISRSYAYRGAVRAAIFDWAGTTCDFGCMAPAAVFIEVFRQNGVEPTTAQAREPMGMHKRDHIRAMAAMPPIAEAWAAQHGAAPTEADVERMFEAFIPMQLEAIGRHADIIPGTLETVDHLRGRGIAIGSCTGYNNAMLAIIREAAAAQGYAPDFACCAADVPAGRPAPWMALRNAEALGVYPMAACVKVGDTPADIAEGLHAGMWSVGVVEHGNEVGLTEADLAALAPDARAGILEKARTRLRDAGAHFVIDAIAELPAVIDRIEEALAAGETP